ncbi:MAG: S41 family peptidase [Anaerolineae bacterium]|nr:S41 family peptidase [Anaerolineae bacterium]
MKLDLSRYIIALLVMLILIVAAFSGGVVVGATFLPDLATQLPFNKITSSAAQTAMPQASPQELETLFSPFWESWDVVHKQYVDQPVDDVAMMRGAIRGMLDALGDPHTSYMDPQQYQQSNTPLEGEYEGIGAWVDVTAEYLTIISPMPNSPAEEAGLKPGDRIIAINGEDMTGIDPNLVLRRVLGPAGSAVVLTIQRENESQPFDVKIIRRKIAVPSIEGKMLENNIALVRIFTFGEKTSAELHQELKKLLANEPKGLILDLRNNGGGYLNTAIEVVSEFIGKGQVVMYEEFGDGRQNTLKSKKGGLATDIPLVVLINEGSASASEITAGAIQDYQRGILVGTTSFGKGSVQNWIPLANEQGAIRVTVARWLTPNRRQIHQKGLEPDIVVEITEDDIKANRDPQLEKAIELLSQK